MEKHRATYCGALLLLVLIGFFVGAIGQTQTGWYNINPIRKVSSQLGDVLGDIESRMPAGHIYRDSDQITWAHETTHGLNSRWRQHFNKPCFYVLSGRLCTLTHPTIRLSDVASAVPQSLRGNGYQLYLRQMQQYWNNEPLYIFDEWTAYSNGAATIIDLENKGLLHNNGGRYYGADLEKVIQFMNYSLVVAQIGHKKFADETQKTRFNIFVKWYVERSMELYLAGRKSVVINPAPADETLRRLRQGTDTASLRSFCRSYFGEKWCKDILGI